MLSREVVQYLLN